MAYNTEHTSLIGESGASGKPDSQPNDQQPLADLLWALKRLDSLLKEAVDSAERRYGPEASADSFRGLYITEDEVRRHLDTEPAASVLWSTSGDPNYAQHRTVSPGSQLAYLVEAYELSDFDVDILIVCIAPELDLRYERLFAYLQNDVTKKRPTVDLILDLLCSSAESKLTRRTHFGSDGPLIQHGLLHLIADTNQVDPPLLAHFVKPDEQILRFLLGQEDLDRRLVPFCRLVQPVPWDEQLPGSHDVNRALTSLVARRRTNRESLHLYLHGPRGVDKRRTAEILAGKVGAPLLVVDLITANDIQPNFWETLAIVFREAWLQNAILYLDSVDLLYGAERAPKYHHLINALTEKTSVTIMSGEQPWRSPPDVGLDVLTVPCFMPSYDQRRDYWETSLETIGVPLVEEDLDMLVNRFVLSYKQISNATAIANNLAHLRTAEQTSAQSTEFPSTKPKLSDFIDAARGQFSSDLVSLAQKIEPRYFRRDIVLPDDAAAQLGEICQRVTYRHRVLDEWGFDRTLSLGKGTNALFTGPSGTGKTMAAEVIANDLGLDLFRIDLSRVVSKYIGETEKNLDRIFKAAENANAILFFDEADALFGKRSEVRDSHDRYANVEISYLLQKMEEYEGVAILATNLRQNLDESFLRRVSFTVHFPFPDEESRRRIWERMWPPETPLADDINPDYLAAKFKLTGGNIKNIVLAAAFLAAEEGDIVRMEHIMRATQREYQKMGKALSAEELQGVQ